MPQTKDNLPVNAEAQVSDGGTITYANEVIAIISGIAAGEVEGIAGMVTAGGLGEIISRNRNITRGVKVEVGTEEVSVDLYTIVEYGQPIQKVATEVQENVRKSIESMTGLHVVRVDVHVQGVSFEREKRDIQNRLEAANIPALDEPKSRKDKKQEKSQAKEEKAKEEKVKAGQEVPAKAPDPHEAAAEEPEKAKEAPADAEPEPVKAADPHESPAAEAQAPAGEPAPEEAAPKEEAPRAKRAPVKRRKA